MRSQIGRAEDWLKARLELLAAEKEFSRQRDALTRRRMAMPWERVEKPYQFRGADQRSVARRSLRRALQLIVYHFMFGPDREDGCPHAHSGPTDSTAFRSISIIAT